MEIILPNGRPFWFLFGWVEHPEFGNFVGVNWKFSVDMFATLDNFTSILKEWNKSVYGHITTRKRSLIKNLNDI